MQGIDKVGFIEKPVPDEPGPNDAIIRTKRTLVCTSDVQSLQRQYRHLSNLGNALSEYTLLKRVRNT